MADTVISTLLASSEPALRYKAMVNVLGADPASADVRKVQEEIRTSPRVQTLLSERNEQGRTPKPSIHHSWKRSSRCAPWPCTPGRRAIRNRKRQRSVRMNEWVTADALYVLKEAGRLH